jgi:hypothetical protein
MRMDFLFGVDGEDDNLNEARSTLYSCGTNGKGNNKNGRPTKHFTVAE